MGIEEKFYMHTCGNVEQIQMKYTRVLEDDSALARYVLPCMKRGNVEYAKEFNALADAMSEKFAESNLAQEVTRQLTAGIIEKVLKYREICCKNFAFQIEIIMYDNDAAISCIHDCIPCAVVLLNRYKPLKSSLERAGLVKFAAKQVKDELIKRYPILQEQEISITQDYISNDVYHGKDNTNRPTTVQYIQSEVKCLIPFEKIAALQSWF